VFVAESQKMQEDNCNASKRGDREKIMSKNYVRHALSICAILTQLCNQFSHFDVQRLNRNQNMQIKVKSWA
jgi:hypothetical protein